MEGVDDVGVGFGPAQFSGQGAESVGIDDSLRLVGGDEGGPAVVLGCAAMVSYSAVSWAFDPHWSYSAVMVSCADSSAPLCWNTP